MTGIERKRRRYVDASSSSFLSKCSLKRNTRPLTHDRIEFNGTLSHTHRHTDTHTHTHTPAYYDREEGRIRKRERKRDGEVKER